MRIVFPIPFINTVAFDNRKIEKWEKRESKEKWREIEIPRNRTIADKFIFLSFIA